MFLDYCLHLFSPDFEFVTIRINKWRNLGTLDHRCQKYQNVGHITKHYATISPRMSWLAFTFHVYWQQFTKSRLMAKNCKSLRWNNYMLKTPLFARFFYVFILNIRFLLTLTHLFNDCESEIRVSNQKPQRHDRCHQDGREQEPPELPYKKTYNDETRACWPRLKPPSDWLRRGRTRGTSHQSERWFLNKGVWEPKQCSPSFSIYWATTMNVDFESCGSLRSSHDQFRTAKISTWPTRTVKVNKGTRNIQGSFPSAI